MPGAVLTFGGSGGPTAPKRSSPKVRPIPNSASYLSFQSYAFQTNSAGAHNGRQFNVLCGDDAPAIVDGYGQWTVINRPLRQGLTIPQGFNPAKIQLNIRFGCWAGEFGFNGWDTSHTAALYVEQCIDDLHWMAGGNALGGPSPVVYIDSYRPDGTGVVRSDLMPRQYRGVPWIIDSGITWNASLRDRFGSRTYQEAQFTVMGYTAPAGAQRPPVEKTRQSGGFFKTNNQIHTARRIAASNSSQSPPALVESLARTILKDPRNNPCRGTRLSLGRRSIDWKIPPGTEVWVAQHQI